MSQRRTLNPHELEELLRSIPHSALEPRLEPVLDYERRDPGDKWDTHIYGRGIVLIDHFTRKAAGPDAWTLGGRRLVLMRNRALVEQARDGGETADGSSVWWAGHRNRGGATVALSPEEVLARGYGPELPEGIAGVLHKAIERHRSMIAKLEVAADAVVSGPSPAESETRESVSATAGWVPAGQVLALIDDPTLSREELRRRIADLSGGSREEPKAVVGR